MAPLSFPRPSAALLATDTPGSVLRRSLDQGGIMYAYTAFGHLTPGDTGLMMLGFNGQYRDPLTGNYQLGNGYRSYNPVLMRFLSADSLSPFSHGGINAYAYCKNDPANQTDPSGAAPGFFTIIREISNSWFGFRAWRDLPASAPATKDQLLKPGTSMPRPSRTIDNPEPSASLASFSTTTAATFSQTPHTLRANSPTRMQPTRQSPAYSSGFETVGTGSPRQIPLVSPPPHSPSHSLTRRGSTDSWDEWSENPVKVARRENEGIANAIRTASS